MNGQSARERELFDKLVRAAIDKKDARKMVQGMAVLARIRGINDRSAEIPPLSPYQYPDLGIAERIEKKKAGGDYSPYFTCDDCPEWHKIVCTGNCFGNVHEWIEQYRHGSRKEEP